MMHRRFFSEDSYWNQPIPADAAVHPNSDYYVTLLRAAEPLGGLHINLHEWTVPVVPVDANTPRHTVGKRIAHHEREGKDFYAVTRPFLRTTDEHPLGHGPGFGEAVPIPEAATPDPEADGHMAMVDMELGLAWDMWGVERRSDGSWWSCTGMVYDLYGKGVFDPETFPIHNGESIHLYGPSRASGVPAIAGLILHHEILSGHIPHKLLFACEACAHLAHVFPAIWTDGGTPNGIPQGSLLQLDPGLNVDTLEVSPGARTVLQALQTYGAVLVDNAGGATLGGEGLWWDAARSWTGLLEEEDVRAVGFEHFRFLRPETPVVEKGMMVGPNPGIFRGFLRHVGYEDTGPLRLRNDFDAWNRIEF
jgi:hypothetical protein